MPEQLLTLDEQRRWARSLEHGRLAELAIEPGVDLPGPGAAAKARTAAGPQAAVTAVSDSPAGALGAASQEVLAKLENQIVHIYGWGLLLKGIGFLVLNAYFILAHVAKVEIKTFASLFPVLFELTGLSNIIPPGAKLPNMHLYDILGIIGIDVLLAIIITVSVVVIGVQVYYLLYCAMSPLECAGAVGSAFVT